MLAMGKSKPWPEALAVLTGTKQMDVGPLKEYFEPLRVWMEKQRKQYNYAIGWDNASSTLIASVVMTTVSLFISVVF